MSEALEAAKGRSAIMISMLVLVACGANPGPIDAFNANRASVRAETEYTFRLAVVSDPTITGGKLWKRSFTLVEDPRYTVTGRWAFDGLTEYYSVHPKDGPGGAELKKVPGSANELEGTPSFEALFDGEMLAQHARGSAILDVALTEEPGAIRSAKGPFFWWGLYPFPYILRVQFANQNPTIQTGRHGGYSTEVETYKKEFPGRGSYRVDVAYDPSIGYLPRFARMISLEKEGRGFVKELYMIESAHLPSGGFLPTLWYETSFRVENLPRKYPEIDSQTILTPSSPVTIGLFEVIRIRDKQSPSSLEESDAVRVIAAPGGHVMLGKQHTLLTAASVRRHLGKKLTEPPPPGSLGHIDEKAMNKFRNKNIYYNYIWFSVTGILLLGILVLLRKSRRSRPRSVTPLCLLAASILAGGCDHAQRSASTLSQPHLHVTFERPEILYDAGLPEHSMTLLIKNVGNESIRLLKADGGCSCRRIDQGSLPVLLRQGGVQRLTIHLELRPSLTPRRVNMSFQTDKGMIESAPVLLALPRHQLSPNPITHGGLFDGEEWSFEIIHSELYAADEQRTSYTMETPPEVVANLKRRTHSRLDGRGLQNVFLDEFTYEIKLIERQTGLFRREIRLVDSNGHSSISVPLVWKRIPYLSSSPESISLAERPVRFFLRCPDDSVEFTRVLHAPPGISSVISSPREVTVRLRDDAPAMIDDTVVVATNATGRPPLSVPIRRYSKRPESGEDASNPSLRPEH